MQYLNADIDVSVITPPVSTGYESILMLHKSNLTERGQNPYSLFCGNMDRKVQVKLKQSDLHSNKQYTLLKGCLLQSIFIHI